MSTLRTELRRMLAQIATTRGAKDVLEQRCSSGATSHACCNWPRRAVATKTHTLAWAVELDTRASGWGGDGEVDEPTTLPWRCRRESSRNCAGTWRLGAEGRAANWRRRAGRPPWRGWMWREPRSGRLSLPLNLVAGEE